MAEKIDIPMNDFAPVQDAEYVYVELADGSQGKMKKSSLVDLINPYRNHGSISNVDINTFRTEMGTYGIQLNCTYGGTPIPNGSILLMFSGGYTSEGIQILCNINTGISIRLGYSANNIYVWKEWHKLV